MWLLFVAHIIFLLGSTALGLGITNNCNDPIIPVSCIQLFMSLPVFNVTTTSSAQTLRLIQPYFDLPPTDSMILSLSFITLISLFFSFYAA